MTVMVIATAIGVAADKTHEYEVEAIRVRNNSATMHAHTNYYVTLRSAPVGKEGIPERIKIGDKVTVKDRSLTVRHIFVTEVLEDLRSAGKTLARKGDVTCTVVERLEDLPHVDEKTWRNRLWIHVAECEPLQTPTAGRSTPEGMSQAGRSLQLVTPAQWTELSEQQRDLYTAGTLELWSFFLYSYGEPMARDLSDFVACVRAEKVQRFRTALWLFGEVEKSAAEHVFQVTPIVCREYAGKGDSTRRPLRILSKSDWTSSDEKKRMSYLTGYIEMMHHLERLRYAAQASAGQRTEATHEVLEKCLAGVGVQGVLTQVRADENVFEWQYPLPWSISKSLGRACRRYRP